MCHLEIWKNVGDENNILGEKRQRPILHKRDMSHGNSGIASICVKEKIRISIKPTSIFAPLAAH